MHYDSLTVALSVYINEFDYALNKINDREDETNYKQVNEKSMIKTITTQNHSERTFEEMYACSITFYFIIQVKGHASKPFTVSLHLMF